MEIAPHYLLLAKLEEEVSFQRKVINTFMVLPKTPSTVMPKALDVLRRLTTSFHLIAFVLEELESVKDQYVKEQALLLASESLSLSSLLLCAIESVTPIFLENLVIYEEPILERIEAVAEFIESSLQNYEEQMLEEAVQTVEDIVKTLEFHIKIGEKAMKKIV